MYNYLSYDPRCLASEQCHNLWNIIVQPKSHLVITQSLYLQNFWTPEIEQSSQIYFLKFPFYFLFPSLSVHHNRPPAFPLKPFPRCPFHPSPSLLDGKTSEMCDCIGKGCRSTGEKLHYDQFRKNKNVCLHVCGLPW